MSEVPLYPVNPAPSTLSADIRVPGRVTTRWTTTLSSKVNMLHAINFGALCVANLDPQPSRHIFACPRGSLSIARSRHMGSTVSLGLWCKGERESFNTFKTSITLSADIRVLARGGIRHGLDSERVRD